LAVRAVTLPGRVPLAVVGDVHGNVRRLAAVLESIGARGDVEGILLTGDLTPGPWAEGPHSRGPGEILRMLRESGFPFAFVPGNHDPPEMPEPENVDGRIADFLGWRLLGVGGAPRNFGFPYEWDDGELELPGSGFDLVLTHTPPWRTRLALTGRGEDAGSFQIRSLLASGPAALVCGHIHEAAGVERVNGVPCYNAGALAGPAARARFGLLTWPGTGEAGVEFRVVEVAEGE